MSVKLYFCETAKCSTTGKIMSHKRVLTNQIFTSYSQNSVGCSTCALTVDH